MTIALYPFQEVAVDQIESEIAGEAVMSVNLTKTTLPSSSAPRLAIYDGRELCGFLIPRGLDVELLNASKRSIGVYRRQRDAMRALAISLGEVAS
jgi:hypothetical protein